MELPTQPLNSTEAEYIAAAQCASYLMWYRELLEELGYPQIQPTNIFEDNAGCVRMCKNPIHKSKARHIRRDYHFIRECVTIFKTMIVTFVSGCDNIADMFTKPLGKVKFNEFKNRLLISNQKLKEQQQSSCK